MNFSYVMIGAKAHESRLRKVLGGTGILLVSRTGWKPVPPKVAGTEARPTPD